MWVDPVPSQRVSQSFEHFVLLMIHNLPAWYQFQKPEEHTDNTPTDNGVNVALAPCLGCGLVRALSSLARGHTMLVVPVGPSHAVPSATLLRIYTMHRPSADTFSNGLGDFSFEYSKLPVGRRLICCPWNTSSLDNCRASVHTWRPGLRHTRVAASINIRAAGANIRRHIGCASSAKPARVLWSSTIASTEFWRENEPPRSHGSRSVRGPSAWPLSYSCVTFIVMAYADYSSTD